jgi:hypothetical protein
VADTFTLSGSYESKPASVGSASGAASISAPIDEVVQLETRTQVELTLTSDSAVAVSIPGASNINVVVIRTVGGKVKARISSSDGATQSVPVDPFMALITESVNITALDVTRVAGQETTVQVFLGERVS